MTEPEKPSFVVFEKSVFRKKKFLSGQSVIYLLTPKSRKGIINMIRKNLEVCRQLINLEIDAVLEVYGKCPSTLQDYAFGFRNVFNDGSFQVGNNHGSEFFFLDRVVEIARVCNCTCHLSIGKNEDGEPTPIVCIY